MRRAAQVLREAGVYMGALCAWTNRWAKAPAHNRAQARAATERAREVHDRCLRQLADDGAWPLSRTAELAAQQQYRRVE